MLTSIQSKNNEQKNLPENHLIHTSKCITSMVIRNVRADLNECTSRATYVRFTLSTRCKLLLCNMEIKTPNFTNEFRFFLSTNPFHLFQQRCSLSCGFLINYIHGSIFDPLVYLHLVFFFQLSDHEFDASIFLGFFHWKFC